MKLSESVITELEQGFGGWRIAFSFKDRTFLSKMELREVDVFFQEELVASFDNLELGETIFSALKSLITKDGNISIRTEGSSFYVPPSSIDDLFLLFSGFLDSLRSGNLSLLDFSSVNLPEDTSGTALPSTTETGGILIDVRMSDVSLIYGDSVLTEGGFLSSVIHSARGVESFSLQLGNVSFSRPDYSFSLPSISFGIASAQEGYLFSLSFPSLSLSAGGADIQLELFSTSVEFPSLSSLSDIRTIALSLSSLSFEMGDDLFLSTSDLFLSYDGSDVEANFNHIVGSYSGYVIDFSNSSFGYSAESGNISLLLDEGVIYRNTDPFVVLENIILNRSDGDLFHFSADLVSLPLSLSFSGGSVRSINLSGLSGIYGDDGRLGASLTLSLSSGDDALDSLLVDLSLNALVNNGNLERLSIEDERIFYLDEEKDAAIMLDYQGGKGSLSISSGESFSFSAELDSGFDFSLSMNNCSLYPFSSLFTFFFPAIENYIGADSILSGTATGSGDFQDGFDLDSTASLTFSSLTFNGIPFDTSISSRVVKEGDYLTIENLSLSLPFMQIWANGDISLRTLLPSFDIIIYSPRENEIINLNMDRKGDDAVDFDFRIPVLGDGRLYGSLGLGENENTLFSDAHLNIYSRDMDFRINVGFDDKTMTVENERAFFGISWLDGINADLTFDSFELPSSLFDNGGLINGGFTLSFDIVSQEYHLYSENFSIRDLTFIPSYPDLSFSVDVDKSGVRVNDILITSDDYPDLSGNFNFSSEDSSVAFILSGGDEEILLSLSEYADFYSGLLSVKNLDLGRFSFPGKKLSLALIGRGQDLNTLSFNGNLHAENIDSESDPFLINADIFIDKDTLYLDDVIYEDGLGRLELSEFMLSLDEGTLNFPFDYQRTLINFDRNHTFSLSGLLNLTFEKQNDFLSFISTLRNLDNLSGIGGNITIYGMSIDDMSLINESSSDFVYSGNTLSFAGSLIDGRIGISDLVSFDLSLFFRPLGDIVLSGVLGDESDLTIDIFNVDLEVLNPFFRGPIVVIDDDTFVDGRIILSGSPGDFHTYGYLTTERLGMDVFWLPGEHLVANNVYMSIWDNHVKSNMTDVTVIENGGERIKRGKVLVTFSLTSSLGLEYYTVDAYVEKGNELNFRFPLRSMNIDILGDISGHFSLYQDGHRNVDLKGELDSTRFELSYGLHELPSWYRPTAHVEFDFNMHLIENSSFVFPLGPNPILSASFREDQNVRFTSDENGFRASGQLDFRAGEIYYFQRSFIIREGGILFRDTGFGLEPVINLRAELRDYDTNGERINIYLVLREATLDNFNPTFESIPQRPLSEIMEVLGNAIISNDPNSTGLSSVVSLVNTGVGALSRFGYIPTGSLGIRESIRETFDLDTVNIHTNILGNMVYEAFTRRDSSRISPLASYLDGTSLYLGKYISPTVYFEALFHLSSDSGKLRRHENRWGRNSSSGTSFLSNDLILETEISLEWTNPMCQVKIFTAPENFNFYEIIDSLGFSVTKQFQF